jgi:1-acyl-sn-glycerol-3-phosphate acyltransferase/MFS family permease
MSSQFRLMREKRFRPFFWTQFLGAFNDNVFKTALITLVTFRAGQLTSLDGKMLATLLPGLFILPFFLFSATSGQLADKFEKSMLARAVKVFEILVMLLAAAGFMTNKLWLLVTALFMMGIHSTLFGPVKYSYLPQHLQESELIGGNGMIEMGTFVAILIGEVLGAWLATSQLGPLITSLIVVGVALAGYWVSRGIPISPASDPKLVINWNPLTETLNNLRFAKTNRTVWLALLGISWFWFYGATILAQFPTYAKEVLHGDESVFILLLTVFSFGIGLGSLLCEKLSSGQVEIGLVPFGAIGLTLFGVDLYAFSTGVGTPVEINNYLDFLGHPAHWRGLADVVLLGLFGGFYIVPLYALIQTRSEKSHQSRVIAANNILNALFMVASAAVSMLLFAVGLTIPQLFLATALFNAVVAIYIYRLVPEFLLRFVVWILVHSIYRLAKQDLDRIPHSGAALIVSNCTSFADVLVITAACPRPIRFVIGRDYFKLPVLGALLQAGRAIPMLCAEPSGPPSAQTVAEITAALDAGELVALFPEDGVSCDGKLQRFSPWINRVLADRHALPVVPLALSGLWESAFSAGQLHFAQRLARLRPLRPVAIAAGVPIEAAKTSAAELRDNVLALCGESS